MNYLLCVIYIYDIFLLHVSKIMITMKEVIQQHRR